MIVMFALLCFCLILCVCKPDCVGGPGNFDSLLYTILAATDDSNVTKLELCSGTTTVTQPVQWVHPTNYGRPPWLFFDLFCPDRRCILDGNSTYNFYFFGGNNTFRGITFQNFVAVRRSSVGRAVGKQLSRPSANYPPTL